MTKYNPNSYEMKKDRPISDAKGHEWLLDLVIVRYDPDDDSVAI